MVVSASARDGPAPVGVLVLTPAMRPPSLDAAFGRECIAPFAADRGDGLPRTGDGDGSVAAARKGWSVLDLRRGRIGAASAFNSCDGPHGVRASRCFGNHFLANPRPHAPLPPAAIRSAQHRSGGRECIQGRFCCRAASAGGHRSRRPISRTRQALARFARTAVDLFLTRSHRGFARWSPQTAGAGGGRSRPFAPCAPPGSTLNGGAGPPSLASASSAAVAAGNAGWAVGEWVPSPRAAAGPRSARVRVREPVLAVAYPAPLAPVLFAGGHDPRFLPPLAGSAVYLSDP